MGEILLPSLLLVAFPITLILHLIWVYNGSMTEDPEVVLVSPGQDSKLHAQGLQTKVADALSDLYGEKVNKAEVKPAEQADPITHDESHLTEKPEVDLDFTDVLDTMRGSHKEAHASGFLHTVVNRLKRRLKRQKQEED